MVYVEFPRYSPDLNPLENVWSLLKRIVRKTIAARTEPLDVDQFWNLIIDCKNRISQDTIRNIMYSMPARMSRVLRVDGNLIAN